MIGLVCVLVLFTAILLCRSRGTRKDIFPDIEIEEVPDEEFRPPWKRNKHIFPSKKIDKSKAEDAVFREIDA